MRRCLNICPGAWAQLLQNYNKAQLHGEDRCFPQHEIIGSEATLARMFHEHQTTKMYSPIMLGEIVQKRSFTASGDVNSLSAKAKTPKALTIEDDQLTYQEDPTTWTRRSLLAVLDGLQSIKFAMIFIQWGSEASIERCFAWLVQRARSRPNKTEHFNQYFTAISWQLCMALRQGSTFNTVMTDLNKFTEFMSRDLSTKPPPRQPNPPIKPPGKGDKGEKGWGKNSKGKNNYRSQPYGPHKRSWQNDGRQDNYREDYWRGQWNSSDKSPQK